MKRQILLCTFVSCVLAAVAFAKQPVKASEKGRRAATVLYKVNDHASPAALEALAAVEAKYGLVTEKKIADGNVKKANAKAAKQSTEEEISAELMDTGALVFAEPDYLVHPHLLPNDPNYASQWHHPLMNSAAAWDITTGSSTIIVAVCDTGVQSTHPDLAANLILPGFNTVDNTTNSEDFWGHGTAVAGCIAAVGNNGVGVVGMGWNIKILPIRISNDSAGGTAYISDMAEAMRYAVDRGAKVVNLSYGGANSATIDSAAQYVRSKGGLHFMSAGNDGLDVSANPDWSSFIIIGSTDSLDRRSSFSNYGTPIDIVAPGSSVYTTQRTSTYGPISGTSFSSPIAAGVGALIYAVNPSFTPAQVEEILFASAKDLGTVGNDSVFGHGRVDAGAAVALAASRAGNQSPVATAVATPISGPAPLTVNFNGSGSTDDGSIVSYAWNFGANGATGTGVNASYTYTVAGTYAATLTVRDNFGATGQSVVSIQVTPDPFSMIAPTNLTATISNRTLVTLRWSDNTLVEDGFYVERGVTSKGRTTWTRVATLGANITTFSQTVSKGTFRYRVQAFSTSRGLSGYSNEAQVTIR